MDATLMGYPNTGIVKSLLEHGARANESTVTERNTALHFVGHQIFDAQVDSYAFQVARLLLSYGADPNAKNAKGLTPLETSKSYSPDGTSVNQAYARLLKKAADIPLDAEGRRDIKLLF